MPGIPARRITRSTPKWLCGCAGGCGSSTRAGDASAGAIHGRASLGHRQTKGAETDMPGLQPLRHTSTLPWTTPTASPTARRFTGSTTTCSRPTFFRRNLALGFRGGRHRGCATFWQRMPQDRDRGDTSRSHPSHTTGHTGRVPGGSTRLSWVQRAKVGKPTRYGMCAAKCHISGIRSC